MSTKACNMLFVLNLEDKQLLEKNKTVDFYRIYANMYSHFNYKELNIFHFNLYL